MPDATNPYSFASNYRKDGWQGTLPLPANKKSPPPTGFTGIKAPYPTEIQIAKWMRLSKSNICLRLAEVPGYTPKGAKPVGYELVGLDVDNYKNKNGAEQLAELEAEYGPLPPTLRSSSRWSESDNSCIYVFLVPTGLRFDDKPKSCIEIIQKRHRYMVVWPSTNPDADNATYRWRAGDGTYREIPVLDDVALLPDAWIDFLTNGRQSDYAEDVSDLNYGELVDWAKANWRGGQPCRYMRRQLNQQIEKIDPADCHGSMRSAHNEIIRLGSEGHAGWRLALNEYNEAWYQVAGEKRHMDEINGEITRSVHGVLSKIQPKWDGLVMDSCDPVADQFHVDSEVAEHDYGGLGPVVGPMETNPPKPANEFDMNDRGNGQHFIYLYGDNVKYVDSRKAWILWDGWRWHRDLEDKLISKAFQRVALAQKAYSIAVKGDGKDTNLIKLGKEWHKWSLKSGDAGRIQNALKLAKSEYWQGDSVAMSGREFDANPKLLGCKNGILILDDDPDIRDPRKEDYVTYNTNVDYVPWRTLMMSEGAHFEGYDLWQEYLHMFLPNPDLRHFVQKVMGHLLIGGNPEKLIVFLWGEHDTGKSTMIGAIAGALGDYFGTIDLKLFRQVDLNPGLIRAVPLRVTAMSEVDAGVMDAATVKRLTGNDRVTAEAKYSNEIFEGIPQFTTLIACNNPPNIKHADEALDERILVLPFRKSVSRGERKYERQKQIEEYSGIAVLSWLVEGWRLYCAEGLKRDTWPELIRQFNGEFGKSLNVTRDFISECLEKARDCEEGFRAENRARQKAKGEVKVAHWDKEWTPVAGMVYEMYARWCSTNGVQPVSHPEFTKDLGVGRPEPRSMNGKIVRCYKGVRVRQQTDE